MSAATLTPPTATSPTVDAQGVGVRLPDGTDALADVDLRLTSATSLGLVGRSGAGKSTLARVLLGLQRPTSGEVLLDGAALPRRRAGLRRFRRCLQYVPQDPAGSLDPRRDVAACLTEPLRSLAIDDDHDTCVERALDAVGLDTTFARRRCSSLSGGQAQRVAIARAIGTGATLLVADEPLSSVDVGLRHDLAALLHHLHVDHGLGLLLITHDLHAVSSVCSTAAVLHDGRVVEHGSTAQVLDAPTHPATRALVDASRPGALG